MELHEIVEKINTKEDFIEFAKRLRNDKIDEDEKGKNDWENNSIPDFLNSIIAFGEDSNSIKQKANWKDFALLLFAGKFYE